MDIVSGPYWYAGPKLHRAARVLPGEAVQYRGLFQKLLRVHLRRESRRLDRYRRHRLPGRGSVVVRKSAGQDGDLGSARHAAEGRMANRRRLRISRATACRILSVPPAANLATPKFPRMIRRKQWKFHPITPKRGYQTVHARHGHRRCERRRPARSLGKGRLVGAAGHGFESRILEVSSGEVLRGRRLADVRLRCERRRPQRCRHEQGGPCLWALVVRKRGRQERRD